MSEVVGIKVSLDKMDNEIIQISKQFSQNALLLLNLKNQRAKLKSIFDARVQQVQRNINIDMQKFEEQIQKYFKTHNNMNKMLEKKVIQLKASQQELSNTLNQIEQKVEDMRTALG